MCLQAEPVERHRVVILERQGLPDGAKSGRKLQEKSMKGISGGMSFGQVERLLDLRVWRKIVQEFKPN